MLEQALRGRIKTFLGPSPRAATVPSTCAIDSSDPITAAGTDQRARIDHLVARAAGQLRQMHVDGLHQAYHFMLCTGQTAAALTGASSHWQHYSLAVTLDELAKALNHAGDYGNALTAYQRALEVRTSAAAAQLSGPLFSETVDWRIERATSYFNIARTLKLAGRPDEAVAARTNGLKIYSSIALRDSDGYALEGLADQLEETAIAALEANDETAAALCLSQCLALRHQAAIATPDDNYLAQRFIESAAEYAGLLAGDDGDHDWRHIALQLIEEREAAGQPIKHAARIMARAAAARDDSID